jgi:hypothetical protein
MPTIGTGGNQKPGSRGGSYIRLPDKQGFSLDNPAHLYSPKRTFRRDAHLPGPADTAAVSEAQRLYRLRRLRDREFGATLFGEPAWDLLLDLYVAASDPQLVPVMSDSIAGCVSTQDTARWLTVLENHGLVERLYSGGEMNRGIVTLTQSAFDRMTSLLSDLH